MNKTLKSFFVEKLVAYHWLSYSEGARGNESSHGKGSASQKAGSSILKDLEFRFVSGVGVGYLVLEAAHTIGIVHNLTVLILFGDSGKGITGDTIFETFSTIVVLLKVIKVIGPVLDFNVWGVPSEAAVWEGVDIAWWFSVDNIIITSEEVDILACVDVAATFTLPTFISCSCGWLCISICDSERECESGFHLVYNYNLS